MPFSRLRVPTGKRTNVVGWRGILEDRRGGVGDGVCGDGECGDGDGGDGDGDVVGENIKFMLCD